MTEHAVQRRLAQQIEAWFADEGIELTMGGEPTFIAADPAGAEWNTAAMGPEKLGYARRMIHHLVEQVYQGALVMQVFGKLYPGEPLPRWNLLALHSPQTPLWTATSRLLLDDREGQNIPAIAERVARAVGERLSAGQAAIKPVPVAESKAPAETVGWVMPLDRIEDQWVSDRWPTHPSGRVTLIPGDSPVGLRLPLNELPEDALRRALSVEVRAGALEIFLPPLDLASFRILVTIIAELADSMDLHDLVFCGYAPDQASDTLTIYGLASDPGVLEVNLPPCTDWEAYDLILRQSAEAADRTGLKLTKLALNGAVHGTGGGSHLTFGGPATERNPFLLDPGRISSMLRYWQNHPALSYLFSGQFVGPGCQAPRIDEGPLHGTYELEVACEGIDQLNGPVEDETIDRFLRHLATDSAGNTHRAEICFDKFGNLAAPNGRMGIIELRAFETFDTIDSMATVGLFVRAVLARLFRQPFHEPLKRFGPQLHDRYFLPAVMWQDIVSICGELNAAGFAFDPAWLKPVFDFRFPVVGKLDTPEGAIEIRQALESWPLLAEESAGATTSRMVDNSTDRLQVSLDPAMHDKGTLTVNGIAVPLEQISDQLVAGIRYKCASAWPALHPHVAVHSPLRFEWLDSDGIVAAAAHYHYWNPDAPVYERRPRSMDEAGARRQTRWRSLPDRIGAVAKPTAAQLSPEFRLTLDLRRNAPGSGRRPDADTGPVLR